MKFRKRPVVIDAVKWDGRNRGEVMSELGLNALHDRIDFGYGNRAIITTLEGEMTAEPGDWIIKGIKGELYPCKPDIFVATYEEVT